MKRTDLFLIYIQTALSTSEKHWSQERAIRIIAAAQDPNVQSMIEGGKDESVEKKANDYLNWVNEIAKRPFWFVLSSEGPDHATKTPEHFEDLKSV